MGTNFHLCNIYYIETFKLSILYPNQNAKRYLSTFQIYRLKKFPPGCTECVCA